MAKRFPADVVPNYFVYIFILAEVDIWRYSVKSAFKHFVKRTGKRLCFRGHSQIENFVLKVNPTSRS